MPVTAAKTRGNGRQSFAAWRDSIPNKPTRPRRLANGKYVPVRNTASRANGRGKTVIVKHAGDSHALRLGRLDMRSDMGKMFQSRVQLLTQHLGGPSELTVPQSTLVEHCARLYLLRRAAWDEVMRSGAYRDGVPRPAVDSYRRVAGDEVEVLKLLGIERRVKQVPDLDSYLRSKTKRLTHRVIDAGEGE